MSASVIAYTRGKTFVTSVTQKAGSTSVTAHGLVGRLRVGGLEFDTIERMDGYVCMAGDQDYANSSMYWMEKYKSYVINPWMGREVEATKKRNILFHPANRPVELEGCVAAGFFRPEQQGVLLDSKIALTLIWEACGGAKGATTGSVTVTLRVTGKMQPLSACTPLTGAP
jgi:hypothetical protein